MAPRKKIPAFLLPLLSLGALVMAPAAAATPPDAELVTVTDTSFTATWSTAEPSDTTVCVDDDPCVRQEESTRFHYAEVTGLAPGRRHTYSLVSAGKPQPVSVTNPGSFTTLLPPPGRHLFDFALLSDVHIGESCSGTAVTAPLLGSVPPCFKSEAGEPPYAATTGAAAIDEVEGRGIGLALLNADNTSHAEYDQVAELQRILSGFDGSVHVARGAHDRAGQNDEETRCGAEEDCFRSLLFPDRPGGRIFYSFDSNGHHFVALDSANPGNGSGDLNDPAQLEFLERDLEEARVAGKRTFIFFHHPVTEYANTTSFPPVIFGVRPDQGRDRFLALMARFPNVVGVLNSHTHRNYVSYASSTGFELPYIENGPTKEYPGGYSVFRVYEGGYMRNFHRLRCSFCRSWTSRTRDEYYGLYPQYTLGTLSSRNFSHVYGCDSPTPPPSPPSGNEAFLGGDTFRSGCSSSDEPGPTTEPGGDGAAAERRRCAMPRSVRVRRTRVGPIRLRQHRRRIVARTGRPSRSGPRALRYCVRGGGRVLVALSSRGRATLITTSARGHRMRGIRRGSSLRALRRAYPSARRLSGPYWATDRSGRLVVGMKRRRVRFVAVVDNRAIPGPAALRRYLRLIRP